MKVEIPQILWHNRDPILCCDICHNSTSTSNNHTGEDTFLLATGGVDTYVRLWYVSLDDESRPTVLFASNLKRHSRAVNCLRFSPTGSALASGDDDNLILVWKKAENSSQNGRRSPAANGLFDEEEDAENKEVWNVYKQLRGHVQDVLDIAWSPDASYLISGSVDGSTIVWDVEKASHISLMKDHKSLVQGVAWDPLQRYFVTLSCDRSMRVYDVASKSCCHNVTKTKVSRPSEDGQTESRSYRIFHDDSICSFFRRPCFTADGEFLIIPAGCVDDGSGVVKNVSHVFLRSNLARPVLNLHCGEKVSVVARSCPQRFRLRDGRRKSLANGHKTPSKQPDTDDAEENTPLFDSLPFRYVFAVATEDSILIYDTQHVKQIPIARISNIHYDKLNDIAWSSNGRLLTACSKDGYITLITFSSDELGMPYIDSKPENVESKEMDEKCEEELMEVSDIITEEDDNDEDEGDYGNNESKQVVDDGNGCNGGVDEYENKASRVDGDDGNSQSVGGGDSVDNDDKECGNDSNDNTDDKECGNDSNDNTSSQGTTAAESVRGRRITPTKLCDSVGEVGSSLPPALLLPAAPPSEGGGGSEGRRRITPTPITSAAGVEKRRIALTKIL